MCMRDNLHVSEPETAAAAAQSNDKKAEKQDDPSEANSHGFMNVVQTAQEQYFLISV